MDSINIQIYQVGLIIRKLLSIPVRDSEREFRAWRSFRIGNSVESGFIQVARRINVIIFLWSVLWQWLVVN
jgi:hypothetical protein